MIPHGPARMEPPGWSGEPHRVQHPRRSRGPVSKTGVAVARFGRIDRGVVGPTREVTRQQSHAMHVATRSSPVRNRLQAVGECKTCMGGRGAPGPANSNECH